MNQYPAQADALEKLTPEDVVALCVYHGGPHANLATFVRGQCVYKTRDPERT